MKTSILVLALFTPLSFLACAGEDDAGTGGAGGTTSWNGGPSGSTTTSAGQGGSTTSGTGGSDGTGGSPATTGGMGGMNGGGMGCADLCAMATIAELACIEGEFEELGYDYDDPSCDAYEDTVALGAGNCTVFSQCQTDQGFGDADCDAVIARCL